MKNAVRTMAGANLGALVFTVAAYIYVWSSTYNVLGLCGGASVGWLALAATGVGFHVFFSIYISKTALTQGRFPWSAQDSGSTVSRRGSGAGNGPHGAQGQAQGSGYRTPPKKLVGSKSFRQSPRTVYITPVAAAGDAYAPLLEAPHVHAEGPQLVTVSGTPLVHLVGGEEHGHSHGVAPEQVADKLAKLQSACTKERIMLAIRVLIAVIGILSVVLIWAGAILRLWMETATIRPEIGQIALPGLSSDVSITYSPDGVAHIQASRESDLWYAQGVVHARDRLWQLQFQRAVATGTLSSMVGEAGLDIDKLFRVVGVAEAAELNAQMLANSSSPAYDALVNYCNGINDWVTVGTGLHTDESKPSDAGDWASTYENGYVPLEMRLLGITHWQAYTPAHSLAWAKVTAWGLAGNLDSELQRYSLLVTHGLSKERISVLYPSFNITRFPTVLSDADLQTVDTLAVKPEAPPSHWVTDQLESAIRKIAGAPAAKAAGPTSPKASSQLHAWWGDMTHRAPLYARAAAMVLDSLLYIATPFLPLDGLKLKADGAKEVWISQFTPHLRAKHGQSGVTRPGASNNWVVSGNYTDTGLPLLANDPHLQLLAPSLWYLNHLQLRPAAGSPDTPLEVTGASFIGCPAVVIGRTGQVAWAVTNTGVDVQDAYIMDEGTDKTGATYMFNGVPVPYAIRQEVIDVKDASPVVLNVRVSRFGPVITDFGVYDRYGSAPLSLRWIQIDPTIPDTLLPAVYSLQRARDWQSFRSALSLWTGPSQNFMYADVQGNIGYQMPGWIPVRNTAAGHTGAYPVPGTSAEFDWQPDPHPFDTLPRTFNPPEGFLVSANNQVVPASYPIFLTADWGDINGYRAARIRQLIQARVSTFPKRTTQGAGASPTPTPIDVQYMSLIQADVGSGFARDILAGKDSPAARVPDDAFDTAQGRALRERLVAWATRMCVDGVCTEPPQLPVGSEDATLWAAVLTEIAEIGTVSTHTDYWLNPEYLLSIFASNSDDACKVLGDTCLGAMASAFDRAAGEWGVGSDGSITGDVFGWGTSPALHPVLQEHQILGATPLACMADRAVQHGGDEYSPNVGGFELGDKHFTQTHGPSYRQIVSLADSVPSQHWGPDSTLALDPVATGRQPGAGPGAGDTTSLFILPMGQRGDPIDDSYSNMLNAWAAPDQGRGYVGMSPIVPLGTAKGVTEMSLVPTSKR